MGKPDTREVFGALLALACFAPGVVSAQTAYTKVTYGDTVVLHVSNGAGTGNIQFFIPAGKKIPAKIEASDAVGALNIVPAADIHVGMPMSDGKIFSVSVSVRTSVYLDPGKPYDSALLLFPEASDSPTPVKLRLEDDSIVSFEVSPSTIATSLNDPASLTQTLHLRNTGKTAIQSFHVAGSNFADAGSNHRLIMDSYGFPAVLPPGQSTDVKFSLPQPAIAGTYAGSITVTPDANSSAEKTIPVTMQSRGPYSGKWQISIPFLLLMAVVLIGFVCSSVLDLWFGSGGLQRAQAFLSLKAAEKRLSEIKLQIADWNRTIGALAPPNQIVRIDFWIEANLKALARLFDDWTAKSVDTLGASASTYSAQADAAVTFADHVSMAILHYSGDPTKLQKIMNLLDSIVPPIGSAGLPGYATALTAALAPASPPAVALTAAVVVAGMQHDDQSVLARMRDNIRSMNWLHNIVVWIVVLITAYLAFYATHYAFGSLADYMTVFLWSLGLTTTGTQLIAGIRKP